jgi:hypothetical protein
MREEIASTTAANTWQLVPLPDGRVAIGCKWVFKIKRRADGSIDRYKARLVAKGFSQKEGLDYKETFAPVARMPSLRALLAIAAAQDLEIHQMDVKTAFLNGDLEEDIYMQQPEGFVAPGQQSKLVCKLNKSLYGLKQAGRSWYKKIDGVLIELGFTPLHSDNCVYVQRKEQQPVIYLLLYVDDLILICKEVSRLELVKKELMRHFDMKDMGEAHFILGLQIHRDRANGRLSLSQAEYARTVLERFDMADCKAASTPMSTGTKLVKEGDSMTPTADVEEMKNVPYSQAVGAVMYAMLGTRPDLGHSITSLSQFLQYPGRTHWVALKRVLRYIQGTLGYELTYQQQSDQSGVMYDPLTLYGYTDSDWGNDTVDRRSITGWVFKLYGGAVSWQSRKQRTPALSSVEAEYMATTQACKEAMWWRYFLTELGLPPKGPTVIYSDSQGSIALAKNPEHHDRTKHIDIQYHFIRHQVAVSSVALQYISTQDMVADVLTKPLSKDRHRMLIARMGVGAASIEKASAVRSSGSVGTGDQ